ncbi:MAG: MFS transporter [Anaerolineae bacterium]|nr:MFS transporter [Anaerolineae bacterium]
MNQPKKEQSDSPLSFKTPYNRIKTVWQEYPRQFWVLTLSVFIDRLGGGMLFPFFSLYVTRKFGVGLTEVGLIFAIFSITGIASSLFGGAMADRMGRKGMMVFGLITSATSALLMGFVNDFGIFLGAVGLVGLLSEVGFPAQQAMVADLVPEEKRAQAYGIIRMAVNLAIAFGPMLGGLLAARSYLLLFLADATTSAITALIVYIAISETYHPTVSEEKRESFRETLQGYRTAMHDRVFMWFLLGIMLSVLIYMQLGSTLPVFLRDEYGVTEQMFGVLMSVNAAMVVLLQFPVTRWTARFRPMMVMVSGVLLYAMGFTMYGFVHIYALFVLAIATVTMGEILSMPVAQAVVSNLSPENMRGRYMATYGLSWTLPAAVGPLLAGLVMDTYNPRWVWYACGVIGAISALIFYLIQVKADREHWATAEQRLGILEQMEKGEISTEEGITQIQRAMQSPWGRLGSK